MIFFWPPPRRLSRCSVPSIAVMMQCGKERPKRRIGQQLLRDKRQYASGQGSLKRYSDMPGVVVWLRKPNSNLGRGY